MPDHSNQRADSGGYAFCDRYIFKASNNRFYDRQTRLTYDVQAVCRRHAHETRDGESVHAALFSGSHPVDKVDGATYLPGGSEIVEERGGRWLNTWVKPSVVRRPGSARPFLNHVRYILDGDDVAVRYCLDWFAHIIQHPTVKIPVALLLIGKQGTGKSLLASVGIRLVGVDNTSSISANDLSNAFNGWADGKSLIVIDELVNDRSNATPARLKGLITEPRLHVNRKGVEAHAASNLAHFMLLSNAIDAAIVDSDDRRFMVWCSQAAPKPAGYYRWLNRWIEGGGDGRVLNFLLERDLSQFNPHARPPKTAGRDRVIAESRSGIADYLHNALEAGDEPFDRDLVILNRVVDHMTLVKRMPVNTRVVAGVLRQAGAVELGQKRVGVGGVKYRVWAIRNVDKWLNASEVEIAREFGEASEQEITEGLDERATNPPPPPSRPGQKSLATRLGSVPGRRPTI